MEKKLLVSDDRILRWPEVKARVGLCRSQVYALILKGKFPQQIKLTQGGRASGWLLSEILDWVANRIEESRKGAE